MPTVCIKYINIIKEYIQALFCNVPYIILCLSSNMQLSISLLIWCLYGIIKFLEIAGLGIWGVGGEVGVPLKLNTSVMQKPRNS